MKKLLLPILSLLLAAPCLNAGLANWISNHLPTSWQVSREYRDEVKYMKHKAGIRTPIIFVNTDDLPGHAAVRNINFWSYPPFFSIMSINENSFKQQTALQCTALNTQALAHELVHIKNNNDVFPYKLQALKREEARAEMGSIAMLATLGYYKALKQEKKLYSSFGPLNYRPKGENYPTCGEYIAWIEQALANCHGIDPNDRPDSENLMRNGPIRLELDPRSMKN